MTVYLLNNSIMYTLWLIMLARIHVLDRMAVVLEYWRISRQGLYFRLFRIILLPVLTCGQVDLFWTFWSWTRWRYSVLLMINLRLKSKLIGIQRQNILLIYLWPHHKMFLHWMMHYMYIVYTTVKLWIYAFRNNYKESWPATIWYDLLLPQYRINISN